MTDLSKSRPLQPIEIDLERGPKTVDAYVTGALAVHEVPSWPGLFRVAHVPTGLCLDQAFNVYRDFETACLAADLANREFNSWTILTTLSRDERITLGKRVIQLLEDHKLLGNNKLLTAPAEKEVLRNGYTEESMK